MHQKFLLYITDEEISLYHGASEKLIAFKGNFKDAQHELKKFFSQDHKSPICLLVDRSHQDIREEKIPPLFLWDRISLLFHKKAEWAAQGGYAGFQFLKEKGETYLRWIHIPQNDSLAPWLLWTQTLFNPYGGIFFVPLEAGNFLKKHLPLSNEYKMLVYNLPTQQERHVIFKGRRLLLSRLSQGKEDIKTCLHFLSRGHPDIHEKLHVLSLVKESLLPPHQITTLPGSQSFINFLASQKKPSLLIRPNTFSAYVWLRKGVGIAFIIILILNGINVYQGLNFKKVSLGFLSEIEILKVQTHELEFLLRDKNVITFRRGLEHYNQLKSHRTNPLKTFEQLSILLEKQNVRLENFKWHQGQELEIVMTFLMKDKIGSPLAVQFEAFLASCSEVFPKSQVQVLSAPFNSSVHESFKNPSDKSLPMAQVRIIFP